MQAQQTLMAMAGRDNMTHQRVWLVQSTSGTKAKGHLVFHILTWDASAAAWVCGCPSRKPCVHMRLASDASQAEQQRADAAFNALTATQEQEYLRDPNDHDFDWLPPVRNDSDGDDDDLPQMQYPDYDDSNPRREEMEAMMGGYEPIMARNDSGPRLYRQPPVLAERQREVM